MKTQLGKKIFNNVTLLVQANLNPVFHFNRIVTYRSIFVCVEVISCTLMLRKQRNTLYVSVYDTVEVQTDLRKT